MVAASIEDPEWDFSHTGTASTAIRMLRTCAEGSETPVSPRSFVVKVRFHLIQCPGTFMINLSQATLRLAVPLRFPPRLIGPTATPGAPALPPRPELRPHRHARSSGPTVTPGAPASRRPGARPPAWAAPQPRPGALHPGAPARAPRPGAPLPAAATPRPRRGKMSDPLGIFEQTSNSDWTSERI